MDVDALGAQEYCYLTTTGRNTADDWQMLKDLELSAEGCCE